MNINLIRTICRSKKAKQTYRTKLLAAMTLVCLVAVGPIFLRDPRRVS